MPNPICHFEIGYTDSPKTQQFYTSLFDWKIEMMGPAAMINTGVGIGGPEGNTVGLWKPKV